MKKIVFLCTALALFLMGCETVTRHYEKDTAGFVVVTTHHADGSVTVQKYKDPKVKSLEDLGLDEKEAVQLIANGTTTESSSSTPTTVGLIFIIIIVIIVVLLCLIAGDGSILGDILEAVFSH